IFHSIETLEGRMRREGRRVERDLIIPIAFDPPSVYSMIESLDQYSFGRDGTSDKRGEPESTAFHYQSVYSIKPVFRWEL
ncbi:hypothetical protein PFISCL1PPCAC_21248, partial [Pristionchus fissidentatus]